MNDKQRAAIRVREALRDLLTAIHSEGEEVPPQMLKVLQVVYGLADSMMPRSAGLPGRQPADTKSHRQYYGW